jgi:phage protein U
MMALGMFVFSLPTLAYQEQQRKSGWRHARSGRIGAIDATQFVGRENDTINLSGTAYAELMAGRASLDELRDMAMQGEAWPLIDGTGLVFGAFVITGIDEGMKEFFPDGTPRRIDFGIELLEIADTATGAA